MGRIDLRTLSDTLRRFVLSKGWSISAEKEIQNGYQLTVTDGRAKVPVDVFSTGKIFVQGKPGALQTELKAWAYGDQLTTRLEQASIQTQPLFETPPSSVKAAQRTSHGPHIGSDESGKGDYFGPLVTAAVYVDPQSEGALTALHVRDSKLLSDSAILKLAEEIKTICRGHGMIRLSSPERYNEWYRTTPNVNLLLAQAHAQVIASLEKKVHCELALVDQFGDESLVYEALLKLGCHITLEQRPRAEDDVAVAAASIVARAEFVRQIDELSENIGIQLPKGASNPHIITVGREIVARYGADRLAKVAKLHFKTTATILQETLS